MPEFVNTRDEMGEEAAFEALIADEITDLKDDAVTTLVGYALYGRKNLKTVEMPSVTKIGGFSLDSCKALESAKFTSAKEVGQYAFERDESLEEIDLPACTKLEQYAFYNCTNLSEIDGSKLLNIGNDAFDGSAVGALRAAKVTSLGSYIGKGTRMSTVDLTALTSVNANQFNGANALVELILRRTSLVTLANSNALTGTPLAAGVGYIYVPADLVNSYKSASNWSARASQIKSIADYPLTFQNETITDTWEEILEAEQDGTYSTKYSVGDVKYIDVGGTKLPMQIVAFDADDLAAGGKAKITWLSLHLLQNHQMNPTADTAGGWAECALRDWLRNKIYPKIESTVRTAIKPVTKTYENKSPSSGTLSLTDTVWIPSAREMFGGSSYENAGCNYTSFFTANSGRIKKLGQGGSASGWWLRSAYTTTVFQIVSSSGKINSTSGSASNSNGVALGFCT